MTIGSLHPLTLFLNHAIEFFSDAGFEVVEGTEIESEWYNFDFLRVPSDHPSRDVQDTFWIDSKKLLRTHTTTVQGRVAKELGMKPPMRIISPGRVFRNEATDASHEAVINQLDGFVIDKQVTMGHLKGILEDFLKSVLGKEIVVRTRPHHYPFVEPGMDVDIRWNNKWLEVIGSGIVHPEVIENMGLDSNVWKGLAFGMGVDRLMMLKYGLDDIRIEYQNDLRMLKQFCYETTD